MIAKNLQERRDNQLWRIPLFVGGLALIIYAVYFIYLWQVPDINKIFNLKVISEALHLPEINILVSWSRAWDLLIIPVLAFLSVRVVFYTIDLPKKMEKEPPGITVYITVFYCICCLASVIAGINLENKLLLRTLLSLMPISAIFGLIYFRAGITLNIASSISAAIGVGIAYGLVIGAMVGLMLMTALSMSLLIGGSIRLLFSRTLIDWLKGC